MKSNLTTKLATIQAEMKAKKSRYNGFGKYYYRAAEDILEAVKPFCIKHNVTVTVSEEMVSIDPPVMQSTAIIRDGESDNAIHAVAIVGVDLLSKGMSMPQKFGAASSYGKKYALGNLLLIDDTADADASNDHSGKVAKEQITSKASTLYKKALTFVANGGDVSAITKKYDMTAAIKKDLEAAALVKKETL
jgi:hypothetical protein